MTSNTAVSRLLIVCACVFCVTPPLTGQTIRPLISEFKNKARGKVELVNDAAWPLNVYLQPRSFTVSASGDMTDAPLERGIHVKLSVMSLRIPPGQSRWVFYEATSDHMPAWFVVYAVFAGFPTRDFKGINVQLELPHVAYILPKDGLKSDDVRVNVTELRPADRKIVLDIENTGGNFGRILTTELSGPAGKASSPGFPLFPGGHRRLELAWSSDQQPKQLVLRSRDFIVEHNLLPSP
jgi:hypothetical protein